MGQPFCRLSSRFDTPLQISPTASFSTSGLVYSTDAQRSSLHSLRCVFWPWHPRLVPSDQTPISPCKSTQFERRAGSPKFDKSWHPNYDVKCRLVKDLLVGWTSLGSWLYTSIGETSVPFFMLPHSDDSDWLLGERSSLNSFANPKNAILR